MQVNVYNGPSEEHSELLRDLKKANFKEPVKKGNIIDVTPEKNEKKK